MTSPLRGQGQVAMGNGGSGVDARCGFNARDTGVHGFGLSKAGVAAANPLAAGVITGRLAELPHPTIGTVGALVTDGAAEYRASLFEVGGLMVTTGHHQAQRPHGDSHTSILLQTVAAALRHGRIGALLVVAILLAGCDLPLSQRQIQAVVDRGVAECARDHIYQNVVCCVARSRTIDHPDSLFCVVSP